MKKVRILSIDGGGMRGIIPATVLVYIEDRLKAITKNDNARIGDYFDLIAGTSTGGILGCFYLVPNPDTRTGPSSKYSAAQALDFYVAKGNNIFNASRHFEWFGMRQMFSADKYSPKNIEKIFHDEFGNLKMSELLKPCVVTTFNLEYKKSFFFSSREKPNKYREFYVRDALRSTSAAPTYFPPARIKNLKTDRLMTNIDGGVFANNPTMCAFAEGNNSVFPQVANPNAKEMLILSVGTGGGQFNLPNIAKTNRWNIIKWAKSIPDIMMNGSLDTVHYQMLKLYETLEGSSKHNYLRVDVPNDANIRNYSSDMADASEDNISALKIAGNETLRTALEDDDNKLNKFIQMLVDNAPDAQQTQAVKE